MDHSAEILEEVARRDPRIVAVILSRNFGHQAALIAALDYVTGDATVVMDGDLYDSPRKNGWGLPDGRFSQSRHHSPFAGTIFPVTI